MPTRIPEEHPAYDDEISLVDLATTFLRRRRVFYAVFGGVVVLALIYVLFFVPNLREYATLVQLAEESGKSVESPGTVIATVDNRWYPELLSEYLVTEGEKLPFEISASNPENTNFVRLRTEAEPEMAERVTDAHEQLIGKIIQRQSDLLERRKQELEQRLESVNDYLDQLSGAEAAGEAAAQAVQNRINLVAKLESLEPAETLVVARGSLDPKGTSKTLILALAVVLGVMLGIIAAFMLEFISHVRKAMAQSKN